MSKTVTPIKGDSTMKLLAYNGSKTLKKDLLAEARKHQEADKFIQGSYGTGEGKDFKGCAVGCTINSYNIRRGKTRRVSDHSVYETDLGIPRILAKLEDRIFEGLSTEDSKNFPIDFLNAINPGADLSLVWDKFIVWVLSDPVYGVIKYARPDGKKAIKKVVNLYNKKIAGVDVKTDTWQKARAADADAAADAAYAAAAYAALAAAYAAAAADAAADAADAAAALAASYAAADADDAADAAYAAAALAASYAAAAADAAADAAYAAALAASYAAADADAAYAARKNHYKKMADRLIEILRETV